MRKLSDSSQASDCNNVCSHLKIKLLGTFQFYSAIFVSVAREMLKIEDMLPSAARSQTSVHNPDGSQGARAVPEAWISGVCN